MPASSSPSTSERSPRSPERPPRAPKPRGLFRPPTWALRLFADNVAHHFAARPAARIAAGIVPIGLLAACAGGGPLPAPNAKHVELAERNGQVTTLAALKVGRSLYIGRCGSCHTLKDPALLTPAEWPQMVRDMAEGSEINADQERAITQYLVAVSAAMREENAGGDSGANGQPGP